MNGHRSPRLSQVLAAAALLFLGACSGTGAPVPGAGGDVTPAQPDPKAPSPSPAPAAAGDVLPVATADAARAALGRTARAEGTARNAKLSGVVVSPDLLVYCLDHPDGWPVAIDGTHVAVTGVLEFTEEFAASRASDGTVSTGTDGGVFVMRACAVESLPL